MQGVVDDELSRRRALATEQVLAFEAILLGPSNPCSYQFLQQHCVSVEQPTLLLLLIDGDVYDATAFAPTHKAGINIIRKHVAKGIDCATTFHKIHGAKAHEELRTLRIGRLVGAPIATQNLLMVPSAAPTGTLRKQPLSKNKQSGYVVFQTIPLSHNTKRVTFASADELRLPPGGHIMITTNDGVRRSYTPYDVRSTTFSILVKKYANGIVSTFMHSLRGGDFVDVSEPIEPEIDVPALLRHRVVVMVAGGTGVAPLYSMAKFLVHGGATKVPPRVIFFACFRDEDDVLLGEELAALADSSNSLMELHFVFSRADISHFHHRVAFFGRLHPKHVRSVVRSADAAVICGPPGFGDSASEVLSKSLSLATKDIVVL